MKKNIIVLISSLCIGSIYANILHDAIEAEDVAKVAQLAQEQPNLLFERNKEGLLPLHAAIVNAGRRGRSVRKKLGAIALELIPKYPDINIRVQSDAVDATAIFLAVLSMNPVIVQALIDKRADVNAKTTFKKAFGSADKMPDLVGVAISPLYFVLRLLCLFKKEMPLQELSEIDKDMVDDMMHIAKILVQAGSKKDEVITYQGKNISLRELAVQCGLSDDIIKILE